MVDVGIELGADTLRAVAVGRFTRRVRGAAEVSWDPTDPADAVARLAERLGGARPRSVGLAIGLAFLRVARVALPPLGAADRRRALAVEPDRHFAAAPADVVVALAEAAPPSDGAPEAAFAAERGLVERWVAAFGRWAPIECVEPAPASIARALGGARMGDATFRLPAGAGEVGLLAFESGRVAAVRRALAAAAGPAAADARELPAHGGVSGGQLAALGAALGVAAPPATMLLAPAAADAIVARRRRRRLLSGVACAAAALLLAVAADRARASYEARVDAALRVAERAAEPGARLQARLTVLDRAARGADALLAGRADPLRVLAALGERLPQDVSVLALQARGDEWQLDGAARDAAAVVPLLDRDARFADVRALAPSSRYESGGRVRETFSVAFRVRADVVAGSRSGAAGGARDSGSLARHGGRGAARVEAPTGADGVARDSVRDRGSGRVVEDVVRDGAPRHTRAHAPAGARAGAPDRLRDAARDGSRDGTGARAAAGGAP